MNVVLKAKDRENQLKRNSFVLSSLTVVAQFRSLFKLKFLCGLAHVRFELADVNVELGLGGEVRHPFCVVGEVGVVCLEDSRETHVDGADDGGSV